MSERLYVLNAKFSPEEACFCRSGKTFAACCGSTEPNRAPPGGVAVINDFLSKTECANFVRFAEKQKRQPLFAYDARNSTDGKVASMRADFRKTFTITLGKKEEATVDWVRRACLEVIQPAFGARVEWFEQPYVLRYGPGDLYVTHSDAEHIDAETQRWYRAVDRDISILIYFNDDYEGGGLRFNHFNYEYKPRAGDLVIFPANNVYIHESRPVITGRKYALASWGVVAGTPRVQAPPMKRIFL